MRFSNLSLIATAMGALGATAAPTTTADSSLSTITPAPGAVTGDLFANKVNVNNTDSPTKRADVFKPGKVYKIAGWVVALGDVRFATVGGTSWRFPLDGISIGYIADQVASSISATIGNGQVNRDVGGGWHWYGKIIPENYEFNGIPYNLMYTMIVDGINSANSWLTYDNVLYFDLKDAAGKLIMNFQIYPAINNGKIGPEHDEF